MPVLEDRHIRNVFLLPLYCTVYNVHDDEKKFLWMKLYTLRRRTKWAQKSAFYGFKLSLSISWHKNRINLKHEDDEDETIKWCAMRFFSEIHEMKYNTQGKQQQQQKGRERMNEMSARTCNRCSSIYFLVVWCVSQ